MINEVSCTYDWFIFICNKMRQTVDLEAIFIIEIQVAMGELKIMSHIASYNFQMSVIAVAIKKNCGIIAGQYRPITRCSNILLIAHRHG